MLLAHHEPSVKFRRNQHKTVGGDAYTTGDKISTRPLIIMSEI